MSNRYWTVTRKCKVCQKQKPVIGGYSNNVAKLFVCKNCKSDYLATKVSSTVLDVAEFGHK